MAAQNGFLNVIGWLLVATGSISFVAAAAGVCYLLFVPGGRESTQVLSSLHDTYYVVRHSRLFAWPLLLCMTLSATIVMFGYALTSHYMARTFRPESHVTSKT